MVIQNKALFKRLQKLTDKELLTISRSYKILNRIRSDNRFQKDYTTMLHELKIRGLLK